MNISPAILDAFICPDASLKAAKTAAIFKDLNTGIYKKIEPLTLPIRPGRPLTPILLAPRQVPKRRISRGVAGRIALLHAIAHIELNAIDLALDITLRFTDYGLPFDFLRDWLSVADDESRHFLLLSNRLNDLDSHYGALPAHDGLWEAAVKTSSDIAGRLAIAPLVLEARGLDVTPQLIEKMRNVEDYASAEILSIIMHDEVRHVAVGKKWFDFVCGCERMDPISSWQALVRRYFNGTLKPPFNVKARDAARFSAAFYRPLAEEAAKPAR